MADNPIQHSDIIQPGNPFDKAVKGLEQLVKLFKQLDKELKGTAKEYLKFVKDQNTATKEGKKNIQAMSKATKQLTEKEKDALRIKKAIEKEQAKLSNANSKEAIQLARLKEKTRQRNAELRKTAKEMEGGISKTNRWGKALGSFQFKFNALGNIAANAVSKIVGGLKRAITKFISFEKIMRSTQTSSDRFDRVMGRLEGSFNALNRALAVGDLTNIGEIMKDAADAAEVYVRAMDTLGDTQNAINIQTAKARLEVFKLQEIYNNTARANKERLDAAQEAARILEELQSKQERVARQNMDNEYERIQKTFQLNDEQLVLYKKFIENYNLLTDKQVAQLEILETKQDAIVEGSIDLTKIARSSSITMVSGTESVKGINKAETDYNETLKEVSKTLGFDVAPIMKTIINTNDEARTKVVEATIAYYDQLRITQRLTNANAAMQGSILNKMNADNSSIAIVEDLTDAIVDEDISINELIDSMILEEETRAAIALKRSAHKKFRQEETAERRAAAKATEDEASAAVQAELDKQDAALETFNVLSDASAAFAEDNKVMTIGSALVNGIAAVIATWKNAGGFPAGIAAAAAQAAIIGKLIANMKSHKFAEGGSGLLTDRGGILHGSRHSSGGVNLGAIGEAERGEYFGIVNRQMTKKYGEDLPIIFDSLNNGAFHDVWGNRRKAQSVVVQNDPWTRKIFEAINNQAAIYEKDGKIIKEYPDGRIRIING